MIVAIEIELNTVREKKAKGVKSYFVHREKIFYTMYQL
jgi:hypothetical protein